MTAVHHSEQLLFYTLLELCVIVLAGRLGGIAAQRLGQSAAVGEIIIGILLGPSLLGWLAPDAFHLIFRSAPPEPLQILSSLGLILLMFQIGLEFDFQHLRARENRGAVLAISIACLLVPFALGLAVGYRSAPLLAPGADRLHCGLFVATAFSITALPILGRIMIEYGLERSPLGVIAISCAAINDVVGWLCLALITALTISSWSSAEFAWRIAYLALFCAASVYLVRPGVKAMIRRSAPHAGHMSPNLLGAMLAVIFLAAICTYRIGIFAIFGGFMMGVILFDEPRFVEAWRNRIGDFVQVFFLPIFFTYTGLLTSIGSLNSLQSWGWCGLIVLLAMAGKLGAAYIAARLTGFSHRESALLGFMMNTRALMELIVINVGFQLGVISQALFTMLVIMAVVSTLLITPAIKYFLARERIGSDAGATTSHRARSARSASARIS